ncbi:MAG: glycosyltransferase family 1 protein, partial [Nitrososphaerota archaeon]
MKRLKVLISAYACEPEKGSEPEVGWNWVKHIAQFADVWVITRTNNRKSIEKVLARESMSNVHWIYFDLPRWLCFWKKGQRGVHLYYYLWQVGICFLVRRLHQKVGFDLIHHVTFGNYWLPSFLPLLSVPFIWGPVGGGESAPKAFYAVYSTNAKFRELLRDLARFISDYNPIHRFIAKKVSVALATTEQTADRIKKRLGIKRVYVMPQFAMSREKLIYLEEISSSTVSEKTGSVIFISVGRNLGYKGFHLGL